MNVVTSRLARRARVTSIFARWSHWGLMALTLSAACLSGGCQTTGSTAPTTPEGRRAAFPIPHDDWARLGYRLEWVGYPQVGAGAQIEHIEPFGDLVFVQESGSAVTALRASGGNVVWSNQLADRLSKFFGLARGGSGNGRLFISSAAELFVLDVNTGTLIERQRLANVVTTRPVRFGSDLLIYGTGSNQLMAHMSLGTTSGVRLWGQGLEGAIRTSPVQIGSSIGAVSETGDVIIVDAASGSLQQNMKMLRKGAGADPVSDGQAMYVAGSDQSLWAFSPSQGTLWRRPTPYPLSIKPAVFGGRLYCTLQEAGLNAIDPSTGKTKWASKDVRGTPVVFGKNGMLVWDGRSNLFLMDPERGDVIAAAVVNNLREIRADAMDKGNLYLVSTTGLVAKLVPIS
jgi:outer membrane protein assembly factor BamB